MTNETIPQLTLDLPDSAVPGFAALLQHGILCPVAGPVQIRPFLLALPGFTADYIEGTVQTIFINGSAADTLDRPLGCGGTLALSAAMPGLAGRSSAARGRTACAAAPRVTSALATTAATSP